MNVAKQVKIQYFALLREERGLSSEVHQTMAPTVAELYEELRRVHGFSLPAASLRAAVNDEFCSWDSQIQDSASVVFIPPVAGG